MSRKVIIHCLLIFLAASVLCLDLFIHQGEAATFDSPIHITNIAHYYRALKDGDFPVTWADGFANYGLPTPLVSQQLTSYIGGFLTFITQDPLLSYKIIILTGALASSLAIYAFLNLYASPESSLVATLLFNFTAYRILNIYVRGALPEFFSVTFIPLILIGINRLFAKKPLGFSLILISAVLLIMAHPFMFVVCIFLILPYVLFQALSTSKPWKAIFRFTVAFILSLGVNLWYILPLVAEMKYFVISRNVTQFVDNQFLSWQQYIYENWPYFYKSDIFVRGNIIQFGVIETALLVVGIILLLTGGKRRRISLLRFIVVSTFILVFMTTQYSYPLYRYIPFLDGIQFPWRMLSALMFIPPLVLALIMDRSKLKQVLGVLVILLVVGIRLPQTYGKNFTYYPIDHYQKTIKNLHFDSLNTIWIGNTASYPVKPVKGEIIEGEGSIVERKVKNSWREYAVEANSPLRMVDNTFYFPGWNVYIDKEPVTVEFQDSNYRGVITYKVPAGYHDVRVVFEPTKIRRFGYLATLIFLTGSTTLIIFDWKSGKDIFYVSNS